jgi:hypothetical protein
MAPQSACGRSPRRNETANNVQGRAVSNSRPADRRAVGTGGVLSFESQRDRLAVWADKYLEWDLKFTANGATEKRPKRQSPYCQEVLRAL